MWIKSYSKRVEGIDINRIWDVWTDVNKWHTWQDDIEYAKLTDEFKQGSIIHFKPKGGPNIKIELTEVRPNSIFIDLTRFPLAKMYDSHELIDHGDTVEIKTTIKIEGPLSFLWRKLVAENIVNGLEEQTDKLIKRITNG